MKDVFFGGAVLCIIVNVFIPSSIPRSSQRRIYWGSTCVAAVSGFLACYPNWQNGLGVAGTFVAAMTLAAYAATPYIRIRGKIYALTVRLRVEQTDPQSDPAPDSYSGMLTPATMWWMLVGLAVIVAIDECAFLFSDGKAGIAAMGAGLLALLAVGAGYGDASWGYRIARGQYVPFGIASIITAGSFALVYLIAYYTARRWPLRRTQSMEYRAHPRHSESP
jgi:hypothetical protein